MALELGFRLPCGDIHSDALDFVNDLPGVTLKKLDAIADSDLEIAKELFYKLERASASQLINHFLSALGKAKMILSVTDMTYKNMVGVDKDGEGYLDIIKYNLSPYISIKINTLIVKFLEAQTITVTILDAEVTTTQEHDVVVGINHIPINYTLTSEAGRISFTANNWQTGYNNYTGCSRCRSNCSNYNLEYNIGFNIMSVVDQNAIIEMYSRQLSYLHCRLWWILLMEEILNTDNINYLVDMSKDQARENYATWMVKTKDETGLFWLMLDNVINGLQDSIPVNEEVKCSGIQLIQSC